LNFGVIGNEL